MHKIGEDITEIQNDPNSFWVGGGDYAEYISKADRRFDPECMADWVTVRDLGKLGKVLKNKTYELFKPIKHKCLGLAYGNHEDSYQKWNEQQDLHSSLCVDLDVPNLTYSALFDVVFIRSGEEPRILDAGDHSNHVGRRTGYRIYVHHGAGAATTPGGKLTRLTQFMESFDADIYFIGHVHGQQGLKIPRLGADDTCMRIIEKERLGMIAGSYLKTYKQGTVSYGEKKGYRPAHLGASIVLITPDKREMKGEI